MPAGRIVTWLLRPPRTVRALRAAATQGVTVNHVAPTLTARISTMGPAVEGGSCYLSLTATEVGSHAVSRLFRELGRWLC